MTTAAVRTRIEHIKDGVLLSGRLVFIFIRISRTFSSFYTTKYPTVCSMFANCIHVQTSFASRSQNAFAIGKHLSSVHQKCWSCSISLGTSRKFLNFMTVFCRLTNFSTVFLLVVPISKYCWFRRHQIWICQFTRRTIRAAESNKSCKTPFKEGNRNVTAEYLLALQTSVSACSNSIPPNV